MFQTLSNSQSRISLITKSPQSKKQSRKSPIQFSKKVSRSFQFQVVSYIQSSLKHSTSKLSLLRLPVSCRHKNINHIRFINLKLKLFNMLIKSLLRNNSLIPIYNMLFDLMRKNPLYDIHAICF